MGARNGLISALISDLIIRLIGRLLCTVLLWLDGSSRRRLGAEAAVHASLAAWLRSHLAGLRQLRIDFDTQMNGRQVERPQGPVICCQPPMKVAAALAGAQLEALTLNNALGINSDAAPVLASLPPTLTRLCITSCQLRSLTVVGEALGPARRLLELGLSNNGLAWGGNDAFAALTALTQLTLLNISANGLEGLPEQLAALERLAELNASINGLEDAYWGFGAFAPLLCLSSSLTKLDLGYCDLHRLPWELCLLSRLQVL